MQTQPLNYAPLVTVIKYGLLFGLVSQADVAEWVAQNAPADPFLLQLSTAGNTAQLQNLINSRRIAGANALTLRLLLGLFIPQAKQPIDQCTGSCRSHQSH